MFQSLVITSIITLVLTTASVDADYDCVCIYAVEKKILPSPSISATPDGYLYEFDCKSSVVVNGLDPQFKAIAYQHKIRYIAIDANVQTQTCRGRPSSTDILTTTPQPPSTVLHQSSTTLSTVKSSTLSSSPQTTTTVSTTPQSTSTVATSPQTTKTTRITTTPTTTTTRTTTFTIPRSTTSQPTTSTRATTLQSTTKSATSVITSTVIPVTDPPVNTTGSPLAFIGIGYNLLTGNPSASARIHGSQLTDPGFLLNRRILKLTSTGGSHDGAREVDVQPGSACNYTKTNQMVYDGTSYQRELMNVVLHDTVYSNFALAKDAFTQNREFMNIRQNTEQGDRAVYIDVTTTCTSGQARYIEENVTAQNFTVSREFATDVCKLPFVYNASEYIHFLDTWGTNIVMSAKLGSTSMRRYKTTPQQVLLHTQMQRHDVFHPTGQFNGYSTSVTINSTELSRLSMAPFGALVAVYKTGAHQTEPVEISLSPIAAALESKYWIEVLSRDKYMDICDNFDSAALNSIRENLHRALQEYSSHKSNSQPLTDVPLTIPLTWPFGTYGLMESSSGCPGDKVAWQRGHRKYDTEDRHSHNYFTAGIQQYMAGFQSGSVYWDDDDISNHNSAGGTLPDGEYSKNTKIYYCCRNDGNPNNPILLPRDKPFVLIRYKGSCQSVYDMEAKELFIRWDDEDILNRDSAQGAHPFDDGGSKDHKLHFCYYRERQGGHKPAIIG